MSSKYPTSLIKETKNDKWIELPNIIHVSFSNTKKYNACTCDYIDDVWKAMIKNNLKNAIGISGNKLSTGEWQIFILIAMITDKIANKKQWW